VPCKNDVLSLVGVIPFLPSPLCIVSPSLPSAPAFVVVLPLCCSSVVLLLSLLLHLWVWFSSPFHPVSSSFLYVSFNVHSGCAAANRTFLSFLLSMLLGMLYRGPSVCCLSLPLRSLPHHCGALSMLPCSLSKLSYTSPEAVRCLYFFFEVLNSWLTTQTGCLSVGSLSVLDSPSVWLVCVVPSVVVLLVMYLYLFVGFSGPIYVLFLG